MLPMRDVQQRAAHAVPALRAHPLPRSAADRAPAACDAAGTIRGVVRFKIFMQVSVDASGPQQAVDWAKKLEKLLKNPVAKMMVEDEGIRMVGEPVALQPKPEVP